MDLFSIQILLKLFISCLRFFRLGNSIIALEDFWWMKNIHIIHISAMFLSLL